MPREGEKVLAQALQLSEFTMPQLAVLSGVSYETVKKVLRAERGSTVDKTGGKAPTKVGRPSDMWRVIDDEALAARLAIRDADVDADEDGPPDEEVVDETLRFAEDQLVYALHTTECLDVEAFARASLAALDRLPDNGASVEADRSRPFGATRNLPLSVGRAYIVRSAANYLLAQGENGFAGSLWRVAFDAIASFDNPDQDALHKFLLTRLMQMAYNEDGDLSLLPRAAVADAVFGDLHSDDDSFGALLRRAETASAAARESVRLALVDLTADLVERRRPFDDSGVVRLFEAVAQLSTPGTDLPAREREQLVSDLAGLARSQDAAVAIGARQLLLLLHEPRRHSFWHELAGAAAVPVDLTTLFLGLAASDLEEAFSCLVERLNAGDVAAVQEAVLEWLRHIDASVVDIAQEAFADFLATIASDGQRVALELMPDRAGLRWPLTRLEDRLVHQFFTKLSKWKALAHADSASGPSVERLTYEIAQLAMRIMPVLDEERERRACDVLTSELHHPVTAALAVDTLLLLRRDDALAEAVVKAKATEANVWSDVVAWYTARREALEPSNRTRLVRAIFDALPEDEGMSFLVGVSRAVEGDAPEVTDCPLDPQLLLRIETWVNNSYEDTAEILAEFADDADFMDFVAA